LSAKGVAGHLYIVGGAAMAVEFDTRRSTRAIDAVLHPPTTVAAGRPQDLTDLVVLFRHLKIRSPQQAVDIAERMYGDDSVVLSEPRESLLLLAESVLARVRASENR